LSIFLHKTNLTNSQILVFYSAQRGITFYGNATNWNSAGYFDINTPVCKYNVNCVTDSEHDITRTM